MQVGSHWNLFLLEEVYSLPPRENKTLVQLILYPSSLPQGSRPLHQLVCVILVFSPEPST